MILRPRQGPKAHLQALPTFVGPGKRAECLDFHKEYSRCVLDSEMCMHVCLFLDLGEKISFAEVTRALF